MRRISLLVALLFSLALQPVLAEGGVGILESASEIGLAVTCPEGVAGCAANGDGPGTYSITGTQDFILKLVGGLLNFAAIAAVVMLIVVALRFTVAHGSQDAIGVAKKQITWTLVGLIVIILSLLLVKNITQKVYEIAAVDDTGTTEVEGEGAGEGEEPIPPAPCSVTPPISVPVACFVGDITGTQYSTGTCADVEKDLKAICDKLGVAPCKVISIQSAVSAYYYVSGHPEIPLPANCSKIDGLYGQCTQTAIKNYFAKNGC